MKISSLRVTITGDRTVAAAGGVSGTTLLCRGVRERIMTSIGGGVADQDTWQHVEGDGAKRGASAIMSRSSDLGVEESEQEDWVLMMNPISVTEC